MSFIFNNALVKVATSTGPGAAPIEASTAYYDISNQVTRVRLNREFEEHDDTVMSNTARSRVPGLETWAFELDVLQGFSIATCGASVFGGVDELFDTILAGKAKIWVSVRTCNGARSTSNPEYNGPARLFTHTVYDGEVGDLLKTNPQFRSAGNLVRTVTAT
jgi:hypothetical protein